MSRGKAQPSTLLVFAAPLFLGTFIVPPPGLLPGFWKHLLEAGLLVAVCAPLWSGRLRSPIRRLERDFQAFARDLDVIIWQADASTLRFTYVSPKAEQILDYPAERWLTESDFWSRHIHPEDREATMSRCREAILQGEDCELEYRALTADASTVWVLNRFQVVWDRDDRARHLLGMMMDITTRKKADAGTPAGKLECPDAFGHVSDIVYAHDLSGNFTALNPAGERSLGYSEEEFRHLNIGDLVAPECRERARQMIEQAARADSKSACEFEVIAKDGRRLALDIRMRVVSSKGKPVGIEGIARDITGPKRLEEQLRQSQKMEAIGRLAGGVAHDFNNLLTVIEGYSDLLAAALEENDPRRRHTEEIKKAAERAASLTRQLLAFSRRQPVAPQVVDLNAVVASVDKLLRRLIGEDVELVTVLQPALGRVRADVGQLEQVLMNLSVNARDAMPEGGRLIIQTADVELDETDARRHAGLKPGRYVMLAASDNGCGMDADTQAHIFEPFFTTKEKGKGTGLGLAIVYGIVKQSGGYIGVSSEWGRGTEFKIYLPRVEEPVTVSEARRVSSGSCHGSETVLLVEDETTVRSLVRGVLERQGYTVLEASQGDEALELAARHRDTIHLMLTDVVMPQMNGRALAERLASQRPELKVLYMSGYTEGAIGKYTVLEPDAAYLQKPFHPGALARKVREVLDAPAAGTLEACSTPCQRPAALPSLGQCSAL